MYHKLARGHATAYLRQLTDHDRVESWFAGRPCSRVLTSFEESAKSKKPGRVIRRLTPLLRPTFTRPVVGVWMRDFKLVLAEAISAAPEVDVVDLSDADRPLYQERGAFLSNLFLNDQEDDCSATMLTLANISHHALTRLLERELAIPKTIGREVRNILSIARNMAMAFDSTDLDPEDTYAFLAPYREGALPIVTMSVRAGQGDRNRRRPRPVMSVRTFLDSSMLGRSDHERMGGMDTAMTAIADEAEPQRQMARWMEVNARPWSHKAAALAEDDRRAKVGS